MLGWIKNKMHKKDYDDMEDIRSNIIGSDFRGLPPPPEPDFPRQPATFEEPINRRFDERGADRFNERFEEPPGFSSIDTRFPEKKRDDYEIIDRLNLIESQLAAIRSQAETINERLKNMERQLGRRY